MKSCSSQGKAKTALISAIFLIAIIALSGCFQQPAQAPECQKAGDCHADDSCAVAQCTEGKCSTAPKCSPPLQCAEGNCGFARQESVCGDSFCSEGEAFENCPQDCLEAAECVSAAGETGKTGKNALPKVRFYWGWGNGENELPENACQKIYCDPVQFTIALMKKIKKIDDSSGNSFFCDSCEMEYDNKFTANLIGDNYSENFLHDFAGQQGFLEAPAWFDSNSTPLKQLLLENRITFEPEYITSGKYSWELHMERKNKNILIKITLAKISDAEKNLFYYLPFNGRIGSETARDYGIKFENSGSPILISQELPSARTGAKTVKTAVEGKFETLNTGETRGTVLKLDKTGSEITGVFLQIDGSQHYYKEGQRTEWLDGNGKYSGKQLQMKIAEISKSPSGEPFARFELYTGDGRAIGMQTAKTDAYLDKAFLEGDKPIVGNEIRIEGIFGEETGTTIRLFPGSPVPVIAAFDSEKAQQGISYKLFKGNYEFWPAAENAGLWEEFASSQGCKDALGNDLPYYKADSKKEGCFEIADENTRNGTVFYSNVFYRPEGAQLALKPCSENSVFATADGIAESPNALLAIE
ncbi:MAG: hypothetical protein PHH08_02780, partial [Candidatus ainarchaeum sp.]|nr:hypothetical protein [Candidatus ainarchaeum sp.]